MPASSKNHVDVSDNLHGLCLIGDSLIHVFIIIINTEVLLELAVISGDGDTCLQTARRRR